MIYCFHPPGQCEGTLRKLPLNDITLLFSRGDYQNPVWDAHVSSPPAPKLISPRQPSLAFLSCLIHHCSLASVKLTAQTRARVDMSGRQKSSLAFGEFVYLVSYLVKIQRYYYIPNRALHSPKLHFPLHTARQIQKT